MTVYDLISNVRYLYIYVCNIYIANLNLEDYPLKRIWIC